MSLGCVRQALICFTLSLIKSWKNPIIQSHNITKTCHFLLNVNVKPDKVRQCGFICWLMFDYFTYASAYICDHLLLLLHRDLIQKFCTLSEDV